MENNIEKKLQDTPVEKKASWITFRLIFALALFLVTLFLFVAIADEIVVKNKGDFDKDISDYIISLVSPGFTSIMQGITFFGSSTFLFPAYILLILFYILTKKSRLALDIAMIGLSSTGILFLFKDLFKRHRPLDPLISDVTGFSFPSGHSFSSFTFFGLLVYIVWMSGIKKIWKIIIAIVLFALAAIIAFSRVYLRVHFPSDVIAGFCLSVVWLMISLWILHKTDRGVSFPAKNK